MATTNRILAQSKPAATTLTDAYTAPFASAAERAKYQSLDMAAQINRDAVRGGASVASIVCCNQGSGTSLIRISVAIAGAADTAAQYLYYAVAIPATATMLVEFANAMPMTASDLVRVYSDTGNVSFTLWGTETGL